MVDIGIAILTRNRHEVLARTLDHHRALAPPDSTLVIVDDASDTPVSQPELGHRFDTNVGIARGKNKCLELLYDHGCEHIFLFDDDAYPVSENWWVPYVESDEPHFSAVFVSGRRPWAQVIYQDSELRAMSRPMGYMLYAHRSVLETVGGMDPGFGIWGFEHISWSNRIHAAGLTSFRYPDVVSDRKLIHSMDEFGEVPRSVPKEIRKAADSQGFLRCQQHLNDPAFMEFRSE